VFTERNPDTGQMERFVYVVQGESFEKRNVKVGVSDYACAEIQDGLKQGDVVSLELPKEEREKKAKQTAVQHKAGKEGSGPGARAAGPASGTNTNVDRASATSPASGGKAEKSPRGGGAGSGVRSAPR